MDVSETLCMSRSGNGGHAQIVERLPGNSKREETHPQVDGAGPPVGHVRNCRLAKKPVEQDKFAS